MQPFCIDNLATFAKDYLRLECIFLTGCDTQIFYSLHVSSVLPKKKNKQKIPPTSRNEGYISNHFQCEAKRNFVREE